MDKKLTDSEIVKALECCNTEYEDYQCPHCPLLHKGCKKALVQNALDLINHLQAENERLKKENTDLDGANILLVATLKNAQTEAYKEFAERLKAVYEGFDDKNEVILYSNLLTAIDCLLIGMVGDSNAE